jgi:hypothetical protein
MTGSITSFTAKALAVPGLLPFLAAPQPGDPGGQGEDFGKSSPVGLLVLILFFVAVGFLIRSMTKHLRKVPTSFDEPADKKDAASAKPGEDAGSADHPEAESTPEAQEQDPAKRPRRG